MERFIELLHLLRRTEFPDHVSGGESMFRSIMGLVLAVAVLLTPMPAQASIQAESNDQTITVSGTLHYVTTGVPHYSLGDYVISS